MRSYLHGMKFQYDEHSFMANVSVIHHTDHNYGADADGCRGISKVLIDDVEIHKVFDGQGRIIFDGQQDGRLLEEPMRSRINELAVEKI